MPRLIVFLCWLSIVGGSNAGAVFTKPDSNAGTHETNNAHFQSINTYLTTRLHTYQGDRDQVIGEIGSALRALEAEEAQTDELKLLAKDDSPELRSIMKSILDASRSCEPTEGLDVLSIIVDHQTFEGQILHQFATSLIKDCWRAYIKFFAKKMDIAMGKLKQPLVESLRKLYMKFKAAQTRENDIRIESQEENATDPAHLLQIFQSFKLKKDGDEGSISQALERLAHIEAQEVKDQEDDDSKDLSWNAKDFFQTNFVAPCKTFLDNIGQFPAVFDFNKYVGSNFSKSIQEFATQQGNKELLYQLHVCRLCRYIRDKEARINSILKPGLGPMFEGYYI